MSRKFKQDDYFICPNCGAEVDTNAKICPECGSDEETGWNPDAWKDGVLVDEPEEFDYEEFIQREKGRSKKPWIMVIAIILLILILFFAFRVFPF